MKTRIELSCTEADLPMALFEVKVLVIALNLASVELKIIRDDPNRAPHTWITVTNQSSPSELAEIYELKRKISELMDAL